MPEAFEQNEQSQSALEGGVFRFVAIFLAGILISLGASYFSLTKNTISRDDAISLTQYYSPYNQDKGLLRQEIADLQAQNSQIRNELNQLEIQVAELRARSNRR